MNKIAIIGFGFCGLMTFYHLTKQPRKIKITIFDKDGPYALGPAFSPFSPYYILNVPANKMSAFSNDAQHFCRFLDRKYPELFQEITENGFAPRFIYGNYLNEIKKLAFENAKKNSIEVEFVTSEVILIEKARDEFVVLAQNKKLYEASQIVLATSLKQKNLPYNFESKNFIKNLWNKNFSYFHEQSFFVKNNINSIVLIGAGLTALDVIISLKERNFQGKIFVTSRRGNFPKEHFLNFPETESLNIINNEDAKYGVMFLCKKIRHFIEMNPQYDLRHIVDSVRKNSTQIWHNFDAKNKKIFLQFLLPYWNIFRHRAPTESMDIVKKLTKEGKLKILKSRIKKIEAIDDGFFIYNNSSILRADCIINCLGFEMDARKYPLFTRMIDAGLLTQDYMMCRSIDPRIHLLGGLNIGRDFESSSIPDLRQQVEKLIP